MSDADSLIEFPPSSAIPAPLDPSPDGLRSWILETCRFLQITPTELAKHASLAPSTLNRFLRGEIKNASLSASTLIGLLQTARELELDPAVIAAQDRSGEAADDDVMPYLVEVPLMGVLAINKFRPLEEWVQRIYRLRIPIRRPFHRAALAAFEVADDHAAPAFSKGSIVVVSPFNRMWKPAPLEPQDGDYLTVFRSGGNDPQGFLTMECTIRQFVISPSGGAWLVPINPNTGIEDLFLGDAKNYKNRKLNIQRPHSLVVASLKYHYTDGRSAN